MSKVFIFGGSFDPVHLGHLSLIRSILKQADELRLVPSGPHPEGKVFLFSPGQRLLMLKAALGLLDSQELSGLPRGERLGKLLPPPLSPKISIYTDELFQKQTAYTIDLVEKFLSEDASAVLNLVVGADQAQHMDAWKASARLGTLVKLWTVPREGFSPHPDMEWNFLEFEPIPLSSTDIRTKMLEGKGGWGVYLPPSAAFLASVFIKNPLY